MARIFFVHWNEAELHDLAAPLTAAGHEVQGHFAADKAPSWNGIEVDAALISLERLPSHGREIADWVFSAKKRRHVPVVFVGGKPEKIAETRSRFPNAVYGGVEEIERLVAAVVRTRITDVINAPVEASESAKGPSGTPLAKKLGIAEGKRFALVDAPRGFLKTLAPPQGAVQSKSASPDCDVIVMFALESRRLERGLKERISILAPTASVWLAWPKRTSPLAGDLGDEVVRQMGLRAGLVDVKVCAIDADWSALKFMVRVADRPKETVKRKAKK